MKLHKIGDELVNFDLVEHIEMECSGDMTYSSVIRFNSGRVLSSTMERFYKDLEIAVRILYRGS